MKTLEDKYIDLIINRCINFEQSKSLLINCDLEEHLRFAEAIKSKALELGIDDVCINVYDLYKIHDYLKDTELSDISLNELFDKSSWDVYAKRGAPIIFLHSTVPGLMDDIAPEKLMKSYQISEATRTYYRNNVTRYSFPWTIAALPNERWAKSVFPDYKNAYEKLYLTIMKICMIDKDDPVYEWEKYIKKSNYYKKCLDGLAIKKMHYTNSLGTDFEVEIPDGNVWLNLDKKDAKGGQLISNMPSFEVFNTPVCSSANGIVYSSRPLVYNGSVISDFSLEFKEGRVVKVSAKTGQKMLEQIVNQDSGSSMLGEVALVPYNSPISNTGLVFNDVLFDENASCHLALGDGFEMNFANFEKSSTEDLVSRGLNQSKVHVDFMIGTKDLNIEAETNKGKVLIMKNGEFNL